MVVFIEEIGKKGLELEKELSVGFLSQVLDAEDPATGFRPTKAAKLSVSLEKVSGRLFLRGETTLSLRVACKRCLSDVDLDLPVVFQMRLVAGAASSSSGLAEERKIHDKKIHDQEDDEMASFELDLVDEEVFDGKQIDLSDIAREQILLSLPMDSLCRETCKGLCTVCGRDLNLGECGCSRRVIDPRLAVLKDIKIV